MKNIFYLFGIIILSCWASPVWADQFPAVVEAQQRAVLSAERGGVLSTLKVDVGDFIKKGSILGVVFHKDLILKKEQQQATRKYLRVLVENLNKLNEKGLTTKEELAKAKMDLTVSTKEMGIIQTEIGRSKIVAPFSGFVTVRHVQPHEWVTPGQPVIELYDPAKLRVATDIPADIAVKIKSGQTKTIWFSDLNQEINVLLKILAPQVDVRSNTIKVYWSVNPSEAKKAGLKPGMKGVLKFGIE